MPREGDASSRQHPLLPGKRPALTRPALLLPLSGSAQKKEKPKTAAELDAEMDDYFLKSGDPKKAQAKLDAELESYKAAKPVAKEGEVAAAPAVAEA